MHLVDITGLSPLRMQVTPGIGIEIVVLFFVVTRAPRTMPICAQCLLNVGMKSQMEPEFQSLGNVDLRKNSLIFFSFYLKPDLAFKN